MELSPELSCDMLSTIFTQIDRNILFAILQEHNYQVERTIDTILSTSTDNIINKYHKKIPNSLEDLHHSSSNGYLANNDITYHNPARLDKSSNLSIIPTNIPKVYRGSKVQLPYNFLRIPGWESKHQRALVNNDFMSLFADPIFLQEVEKEFGPDYELVLREHLRAVQESWTKEVESNQGGRERKTEEYYKMRSPSTMITPPDSRDTSFLTSSFNNSYSGNSNFNNNDYSIGGSSVGSGYSSSGIESITDRLNKIMIMTMTMAMGADPTSTSTAAANHSTELEESMPFLPPTISKRNGCDKDQDSFECDPLLNE